MSNTITVGEYVFTKSDLGDYHSLDFDLNAIIKTNGPMRVLLWETITKLNYLITIYYQPNGLKYPSVSLTIPIESEANYDVLSSVIVSYCLMVQSFKQVKETEKELC